MPGLPEACWNPAEGTTEELVTIVDRVGSYPIILCHQAEEFVSQNVVGE